MPCNTKKMILSMVHFCSKKYQAKSEKDQATIQVHAKWAVQYKLYREGELGIVEDGTKLLFGDLFFIAIAGDVVFDIRHAVEVSQ